MTETLLETELFGHVKGAFTGAAFAKQRLFESADKGTIFSTRSERRRSARSSALAALNERPWIFASLPRLNVVAITVPPLRERLADLPLLIGHFLKRHRRQTQRPIAVHGDVLDMLREYTWPGNVRELENMVERAVTLNTSGVLTTADFADHVNLQQMRSRLFPETLYRWRK